MSAGVALYRLATAALEPFAGSVLKQRARRGKEDLDRIGERLGYPSASCPPRPVVWLHGASVGESLSLLPLVEALAHGRPDLALLVTSGTVTSAELLVDRLPPGAIHQYVPVDAPGVARRFLAHWRPGLAVFAESELWPNLLLQAKASGARLALLGARISEKSARGWARAPGAARTVFGAFDLILAQDAVSRARLEAMGARVSGELDLKHNAGPLPCDETQLAALRHQIGARPVLAAASTHPGEDEIVVEAFRALPPEAAPLLVLAPRHPDRAAALAETLRAQGLSAAQRSLGEHISGDTEVYLADTLGELGLLFRLAHVVVMGGSLTSGIGGHNPLEPARLGLAAVTGPDVANFQQTYARLIRADAAVMAANPAALTAAVAELMNDPERARAMGERARDLAHGGEEVLQQVLAALEPLLPPKP